jgi:starch-binding outer membrane protein, SusD/RagB family
MEATMPTSVMLRALPLCALLGLAACDLDLTNPNTPPEEVVLGTPDGIIALAVGMQAQFAGTGVGTGLVLSAVRTPALVTDEWGTNTRALAADQSLQTGAGVDPSFGVVSGPFTSGFRVIRSAESLLDSAGNVGLAPGMLAGIRAAARTYKAMTLGILIQQYPQIPVTARLEPNPLYGRDVVLDSVLSLLASARAELNSVPVAQLADFRTRVQGTSYDLGSVIDAMTARYQLMRGNYPAAIEAAARVPLNRLNTFTYPDPNRNPIWGYAYSLLYVAGLNEVVTEAEPGDLRPAYWLRTDQAPFTVRGVSLRNLRRPDAVTGRNDFYPIFQPDEMRLIQAEAYARLGDFAQALLLLNAVRTQGSSPLDEPVAGLPALTADQMDTLDEALRRIAYERRYELYMQGLRWEDIRRLGSAVVGETPSVSYLPLPQGECLYNPDAPC